MSWPYEFPARGACGGEVIVPLGEFGLEVEDLLLQFADPVGKRFDVGGAPRPEAPLGRTRGAEGAAAAPRIRGWPGGG